MHDVVVAGGGPAGLAVALGACRAGLDVVVYDKRAEVIDKACGEGLMPGALRHLLELGVDPPGQDIRGITYQQGDCVAHAPFRHGPGRGVRRTVLHEAMRAAVLAEGVEIRQHAIGTITQHDDRVDAGDCTARYLVAADGLHSPIRSMLGLSGTTAAPARWGLRQHFALAPFSDHVEVTWAARSEAYVTPVDAGTIGVALLSSARGGFDEQLAQFPALAKRLAGAPTASEVRGAGPLRQVTTRRRAGRVLLVGDAAGYVDALTGEGLALSFAAAAELVRCVVADRPEDYERRWSRVSRRSRWLTSGLLWARTRPALGRRVVPLAARAPILFRTAVDQLAR